ncbi:histidine phosphatase family protein [soil metagenome]
MSNHRLFIIRHGETDFNKKDMMQGRGIDAPLNKTGKKQSHQLTKALKNESADQVIASSMMRSIQTAQILAISKSLPIQSYDELDEMNFGKLEGRKSSDIKDELDRIHNEWAAGNVSLPIPGGESPLEVFERANGKLQELMLGPGSKTLFIVLHGRLIRILLSAWLGYGLNNMHKIDHHNGAIYHVIKNGASFEEVYLNKKDHLIA